MVTTVLLTLWLVGTGAPGDEPIPSAAGQLAGQVLDASDRSPVRDAVITVVGARRSLTADSTGQFVCERLRPGEYAVQVAAVGYVPLTTTVQIDPREIHRVEILLARTPTVRESVIVTAMGYPESERRLVQSVGAVEQAEISRPQGVALSEVLNEIPGVKAESQAATQEVRISIRGRGVRTSFGVTGIRVLVDGMPESDSTGETADLTGIEMEGLQRIEVVKGPMAAQYGASSSGVVNVITQPGTAQPLVSVRQSGGSYGFAKSSVSAAGTAGRLQFMGLFARTGLDGYREHSDLETRRFTGRFDVNLSPSSGAAVFVRRTSNDSQLPGNLTAADVAADRRQAAYFFTLMRAESNIDRSHVGTRLFHRWNGSAELTGTLYRATSDFSVPVPFVIIEGDRSVYGGSLGYLWNGTLASRQHTVSIGTDLRSSRELRQDPFNDNGERAPFLVRDEDRQIQGTSLHAVDAISLSPRLGMTFGLTYSRVLIDITDRLTFDGDDSGEKTFSQTSWLAGATYDVGRMTTVFGNVATGFDPPTISAIGRNPSGRGGLNTALKPERSTNFEAGARLNLARAFVTASAFHLRVRDEIVPTGEGVPQEIFTNAAQTRHTGLELASAVTIVPRVHLRLAYTYSHFRFTDFISREGDVSGRRLPGIPTNRLLATLRYIDGNGTTAGLSWRTVGRMYADDVNAVSSDAYQVADAFAGFSRRFRQLRVGFQYQLSNLFDEEYSEYLVINDRFTGYFYPSPTRNHAAAVTLGWAF